jgi:hypothetical protein
MLPQCRVLRQHFVARFQIGESGYAVAMPRGTGIYEDEPRDQKKAVTVSKDEADEKADETPDESSSEEAQEPPD